jgi:hypothetical protein
MNQGDLFNEFELKSRHSIQSKVEIFLNDFVIIKNNLQDFFSQFKCNKYFK